jgi:LysR family hydrogen peroxide-inducible transcriptional activator
VEIHQLRYFRAVAEARSFTLAAKREHVSQPTLSHQILKLEDELGAELFRRTGKSVKLTELGEVFLPAAASVLRQLTEVKHQIRETAGVWGGRVRLGVIPTVAPFLLPNILAAFSKRNPLIEVRVIEEVSSVLLQFLRDGSIDLGIMPSPASTKGLLCTELLSERLFAVVCDTHPLAQQKSITLVQLAETAFLFLKDGHCFRENVTAMFGRVKLQPRIVFESGCYLTILNMVKAGMGVSVVPEMAVNGDTGCRFVPIESDQPVRIISLVQLQRGRFPRAQELLADFFKESHAKIVKRRP